MSARARRMRSLLSMRGRRLVDAVRLLGHENADPALELDARAALRGRGACRLAHTRLPDLLLKGPARVPIYRGAT